MLRSLYARIEHLIHEVAKFGTVGAFAYVVDVGVFNAVLWALGKPLTAKIISTLVATTVAYFGNRHWTYRHRDRSGLRREYVVFLALNGIGLLIALTCLGVSHYLLGFTSPLADNIAANVVGIGLGTVFRFWSYRRWVFPAVAVEANAAPARAA